MKNIAVALASRCNRLNKSPGLRSSDLPGACVRTERRIIETEASRSDAKSSWHSRASICIMPVVLCNDSEIKVDDGEICQICGQVLEEFDEVTGTGIHGYYHWTCVCHTDA